MTGSSPLMIAAVNGLADAARALVGSGADLTLKNDNGETVLKIATEAGKAEVVKVLRAAGAAE